MPVSITLFYRNTQVNMAISMKSALVIAIFIIGLVQTVKSACPNYGMLYGNCGSDIKFFRKVSWQRCAMECKFDRRCVAWSWAYPQSDRMCWLHNSRCGYRESTRRGEYGICGTSDCQG